MLTPSFKLQQTDNFLTIVIRAPFAKISETEVFVDGNEFKFYSKPYYLRLSLPGEIVEDGRERANYDSDSGIFTLVFPKVQPDEVFEGLDMLTKLLAPSGERSAKQPLIEVVDESAKAEVEAEDQLDTEDFDWQIEQIPYTDDSSDIKVNTPTYGFANRRSGVFQRLQNELHITDLPDADNVPAEQRHTLRQKDEQQHFNEDHYLYDLYDNEMIPNILAYKPPWSAEYSQIVRGSKADDVVSITEEEKEVMRKLPRIEYNLDLPTTQQVLLSLVDIIFAYCYNHRTTEGENTGESGWTIAKLSATLSWLQTYGSLKEAVIACYRRSLCFPLYRHWELTDKVYKDTWKIFAIGRRRLLKCLLEIRNILMDGDSRYILNDIYITDYCVWIQSIRTRQLESLARSLRKIRISKADVGFDIDLLEQAARLAIEDEKTAKEVTSGIQNLNIEADCLSNHGKETGILSTEASCPRDSQHSACVSDSENKIQETNSDSERTKSHSKDSDTNSSSSDSESYVSQSDTDSTDDSKSGSDSKISHSDGSMSDSDVSKSGSHGSTLDSDDSPAQFECDTSVQQNDSTAVSCQKLPNDRQVHHHDENTTGNKKPKSKDRITLNF